MAGADRGVHTPNPMFGLSAALATPFNADLSVDLPRMIAHAVDLLTEGCSSVTLFGTTDPSDEALDLKSGRVELATAIPTAGIVFVSVPPAALTWASRSAGRLPLTMIRYERGVGLAPALALATSSAVIAASDASATRDRRTVSPLSCGRLTNGRLT